MHTVAPIWRAAALALPLAAAIGCDWIPVRRRLDPSLYPVPARADAAYLRDELPVRGPRPAVGPADPDRPALALNDGRRDLPPLPSLTPVSPEEALAPPAPTPLLDAALGRVEVVRSAALDDVDADAAGPPESAPPATVDPGVVQAVMGPPDDPVPPPPIPEGPGRSPIPEAEGDAPPEDGAVELPPLEPVPSDADGPPPVEVAAGPDPDKTADQQEADLAGLLERAEGETGGGPPEARESLRRAADRLAGAEAEAEGEGDEANLWEMVMEALSEPDPAAPSDGPITTGTAMVEPMTLRVITVAFCREVVGFGRVEHIEARSCRAGQSVIVYCELEGVRYEPEGDGHASRLSTTLEILPDSGFEPDAPALWRDVRPVEDRCPRARRDYFVNYLLTLPGTLSPGSYRLRVSQRDLLSGADAIGEVPFSVVQGDR